MASRPVALPEVFNGEGSWTDWLDHFESVADVNEWDAAANKKWIRARLTGRAAKALRKLPDDDCETFDKITATLKKRFEPKCKKEVYMAEFQAKRKKRTEDWAAFGEDLKTLVERAYPMLQAEAQELLALNHFLSQLEDSQLSFGDRRCYRLRTDLQKFRRCHCKRVQARIPGRCTEELEPAAASFGTSREDRESTAIQRQQRLTTGWIRTRIQLQSRQLLKEEEHPKKHSVLELQGRGSHLPQLPEALQGSGKRDTLGAVSQATKGEQEAQEDKENVSEKATIPLLTKPNPRNTDCVLKMHVNEIPASCLVDTGAVATIMSKLLWERWKAQTRRTFYQLNVIWWEYKGTLSSCWDPEMSTCVLDRWTFPLECL